MTTSFRLLLVCLLSASAACAEPLVVDPSQLKKKQLTQWKVPIALQELSGLALTEDERLLAIGDEVAVVVELDYEAGAGVKAFSVGRPVLRDDFEGLAVVDGLVHAITSDGKLYTFLEGGEGEAVTYRMEVTGAGEKCEVEGLDHMEAHGFVISCKHVYEDDDRLVIFSYRDGQLGTLVDMPEKELAERIDKKNFSPSGIKVVGDVALLIAGPQTAWAEIGLDGTVRHVQKLSGKRHKQVEGIERTGDGRVLLGDEAGKKHTTGRLGVYVKP